MIEEKEEDKTIGQSTLLITKLPINGSCPEDSPEDAFAIS